MVDLRVGVLGRIRAGEDTGRFVEVIDDTDDPGRFLILTFDNADRSGNAYDSWVQSTIDIELYSAESSWEVEWLDQA